MTDDSTQEFLHFTSFADDAAVDGAEAEGCFESLWATSPRLSSPDSQQNVASQVDYRQGFDDGARFARAAHEEEMAQLRAEIEQQMLDDSRKCLLDKIGQLSDNIARAIADLELRTRGAILDVLQPIAVRHITQNAQVSLVEAVERIVQLRGALAVRVQGPCECIEPLCAMLEARGLPVQARDVEVDTISVELAETRLRSDLPRWMRELEGILR